jgi:hypothetical protein
MCQIHLIKVNYDLITFFQKISDKKIKFFLVQILKILGTTRSKLYYFLDFSAYIFHYPVKICEKIYFTFRVHVKFVRFLLTLIL